MIKILTVIGARPQIIKASAISRAIRNNFGAEINEILVHTGQHYDENMSQVFFNEMKIPAPGYNLHVGSASHGVQTAKMISGIEELIIKEKPDALVVYGDTNSTLAAAVAASKVHCPVVHIEAGLRSFNKSMPEEINRIMCDHVSTLLFSPTETGYKNLVKEGFNPATTPKYTADKPGIFHCGDIMYDNSLYFSKLVEDSTIINGFTVPDEFILATVHRDTNTDNPERLNSIFEAIENIATNYKIHVLMLLHPRTKKILSKNLRKALFDKVSSHNYVKLLPPASFLEILSLETKASLVITDSGGVQKEAYFFKKPGLILRPQTEWVEIVESGAAIITDADYNLITESYSSIMSKEDLKFPPIFGDGKASEFICGIIADNFS